MVNFLLLSSLAALSQAAVVGHFSGPGRLTGSSFGIPGVDATYDYVIVGGGLAGSVVAGRLTEKSNASVALIEAGNFYELSNGNWSQIPSMSLPFIRAAPDFPQPLIDWGLYTEPQVNGKVLRYTQGKNLGGSSGRTKCFIIAERKARTKSGPTRSAIKPIPGEHDRLFPTEHAVLSQRRAPLSWVTYPTEISPFATYGPDAYESVGLKQQAGFASGVLDGYAWWQYTIDPKTGLRSSSESSFLNEAFARSSLTTYVNAQALSIVFENKTATGVNVTINGMYPFLLSARREVIVSAGVWHSPQLLMVSGVGPRSKLEEFDIPVVSDLPGVGQNMWDTCAIGGVSYEIEMPEFTAASAIPEEQRMHEAVTSLLANATGPLTNEGSNTVGWYKIPESGLADMSATARTALQTFPEDWPEIEINLATSATLNDVNSTSKLVGTISGLLIAPLSRGNMTIRSASNLDAPVVNPNWLRDPTDQEVAVTAYKVMREMWNAIPVKVGEEVFPGKNVTTDEQLHAAVMSKLSVIHHSSASCAMGNSSNPDAVVDSKARVFGVRGLRVIDSSSLPFTPPGHTQGTTYAHAEKLVQDVLDAMHE
ncbi:unnamed protein product [Zymoseptoria tritici ST99CH_3D7]|uniref:Glucose-methanol-choline oxidoreductase N-terminal domain-containing protein n=1 Tax=Zymoseptoria tritici (strain ST99CH_3D7) TaxID=1276538 RepID=A0A1X7RUG2_ZYMT9|nr:unnamed protein product [Zymoseptoria tritici ST99CH_3D7]